MCCILAVCSWLYRVTACVPHINISWHPAATACISRSLQANLPAACTAASPCKPAFDGILLHPHLAQQQEHLQDTMQLGVHHCQLQASQQQGTPSQPAQQAAQQQVSGWVL
jgi:hypothetical protein